MQTNVSVLAVTGARRTSANQCNVNIPPPQGMGTPPLRGGGEEADQVVFDATTTQLNKTKRNVGEKK